MLINQQQAQANSENVKVIDRAVHARKGRNMRVLLFALGVIGWGGTLAMIALMRVFLDPALYIGQQVRGRRRADRANDKAQAPVVPVVVKPAEYAPEPTPPIPEPVAASHIPQTWQDDPNAQTYAPPPSAPPVQSAYVEPNAYAVQNAYVGNAAPDFNANPYSQQSVAGYGDGSTQPYIGVVPQSPEG